MYLTGKALTVFMALTLVASIASSGELAPEVVNTSGDLCRAANDAVNQVDRISYEKAEADAKMSMLTAKNQLWMYGKTGAMKVHSDGSYVDSRPSIPGFETKIEKAF